MVKWQTSYLHVSMLTLAFTLKYNLIKLLAWLETFCKTTKNSELLKFTFPSVSDIDLDGRGTPSSV